MGAEFVDLVDAYDPDLRALARDIDRSLTEGVYAGLPGPHYETPAEIRMLRTIGADLVGMSTVHETIAARALGARVLGISMVTNLAAGITGEHLTTRRSSPRAGRPPTAWAVCCENWWTLVSDPIADWIDADPDPETRAELANLATTSSPTVRRSAGFGTAGLRGPVRAGPNGMNLAVVIRTTAGLSAWLKDRCLGGSTVVVGRDARHGSEKFAVAAAEVLAAAGFSVVLLPRPLPTPIVAFAVRRLRAAAGVQITASHNPAADNGYKVYLDGGAQLISPSDREIEASIARVGPANLVPRTPVTPASEELLDLYLDRVASLPHGTVADTAYRAHRHCTASAARPRSPH